MQFTVQQLTGNRALASPEIRRKSADANVCVSFLPTVAVPESDCAIFEWVYTVWTVWISIRVRVRVRVYFILHNLAPPGTTVHVATAYRSEFLVALSRRK